MSSYEIEKNEAFINENKNFSTNFFSNKYLKSAFIIVTKSITTRY
jgi:hypothetical protein